MFRYANTYPPAIEFLSRTILYPFSMPNLGLLITQKFKGLTKIQEAFEMAAKEKDDHGKLVLKVVVDMTP